MISLEEQVAGGQTPEGGIVGEVVQQRRYPAATSDEVCRRIRELGVAEENLHRYFPVDPETFANHS